MVITKAGIRVLVSAIVALLIFQFWNPPEGSWLIFSAIIFVNFQIEDSFVKNQGSILILGLFLLVMILMSHFLSGYFFLLAGFLFTTVFWGIYLGLKQPVLLYPALIINLTGLLALNLPLIQTIHRIEAVGVGLIISLIIRSLVWPPTLKNNFQQCYDEYLIALQALQKQLFEIYLKRDYSDKKYFYERELHQKRFKIFHTLNKMGILTDKMPPQMTQFYSQLLTDLNGLTEHIISLGNLRYRIKDYSTLEVCEKELTASMEAIQQAIEALQTTKKFTINDEFIIAFEMIYQTTLKVVTNEPWIFLVFIHNIKELLGEFKGIKNA